MMKSIGFNPSKGFVAQRSDLIPIILFFNEEKLWSSFKQYKFVAANPQSTLLEFVKFLENRLVWDGYLPQNSPTLFLAIKQKQLTPTSGNLNAR